MILHSRVRESSSLPVRFLQRGRNAITRGASPFSLWGEVDGDGKWTEWTKRGSGRGEGKWVANAVVDRGGRSLWSLWSFPSLSRPCPVGYLDTATARLAYSNRRDHEDGIPPKPATCVRTPVRVRYVERGDADPLAGQWPKGSAVCLAVGGRGAFSTGHVARPRALPGRRWRREGASCADRRDG